MTGRTSLLVATLTAAACGRDPCAPQRAGVVPEHLCAWGLFQGTGAEQAPAAGVHAYEVIAPLFTDGAEKLRFFRLPPGGQVGYSDEGTWEFPVGTVVAKTFALPRDDRDPTRGRTLIETRLMVREGGGWRPHVYRWNEAQTDATRLVPGARVHVPRVDAAGAAYHQEYRIPSGEDCWTCHARDGALGLLGLRTRQLARSHDAHGDQIDHLHTLGLFERAPTPAAERPRLTAPDGAGDLDARARSYLDGNCGHCHRRGGDAGSTGLWLGSEDQGAGRLGVCKTPRAAGAGAGGLEYDVVPGSPERSILAFRMSHTEPDIRMPELGALQLDSDGLALIRRWIAAMPASDCAKAIDAAR
ncbi:MAG: hypothetical protein JNL82_01155 [Myxococcales bacterium]|nr:hypothetical protein [Myxococcales bacterium]